MAIHADAPLTGSMISRAQSMSHATFLAGHARVACP